MFGKLNNKIGVKGREKKTFWKSVLKSDPKQAKKREREREDRQLLRGEKILLSALRIPKIL